jgi:hypothetical protein
MTLVRIIKNWDDWPLDLMRQTPGCKGIWDNIEFTVESIEDCDYVVVLNFAFEDTIVRCPPYNVWAIIQEPPVGIFKSWHRGAQSNYRVYTSDENLRGKRYVHSQPALPWYVDKDYDFLANYSPPLKKRRLSWITTNKSDLPGHSSRLRFLEGIRSKIEFDLFGLGFEPIKDKWDGLAPYQYSFAIENFRNPYYWSEKIADCFLAWTMPIYYGCSRICEYFPAESLIQIDTDDPGAAEEKIREAISSDLWFRNLDAINEARKLVLNRYQLFPFCAREIGRDQIDRNGRRLTPKTVTISRKPLWRHSLQDEIRRISSKLFG